MEADSEEIPVPEAIVGHNEDKTVFFIKWVGYSSAENSWQPKEKVPPALLARYLSVINRGNAQAAATAPQKRVPEQAKKHQPQQPQPQAEEQEEVEEVEEEKEEEKEEENMAEVEEEEEEEEEGVGVKQHQGVSLPTRPVPAAERKRKRSPGLEPPSRKTLVRAPSDTHDGPRFKAVLGVRKTRKEEVEILVEMEGGKRAFVPSSQAYIQFPQLCLEFYHKNLLFVT